MVVFVAMIDSGSEVVVAAGGVVAARLR